MAPTGYSLACLVTEQKVRVLVQEGEAGGPAAGIASVGSHCGSVRGPHYNGLIPSGLSALLQPSRHPTASLPEQKAQCRLRRGRLGVLCLALPV